MLQAPPGSLLHKIFAPESRWLSNLDANQRPYLDYPATAFRYIADHFRLLSQLSPENVLRPVQVPANQEKQVRELAWILGVEDIVFNPQYGTDPTLPRLPPRKWQLCCARRSPRVSTKPQILQVQRIPRCDVSPLLPVSMWKPDPKMMQVQSIGFPPDEWRLEPTSTTDQLIPVRRLSYDSDDRRVPICTNFWDNTPNTLGILVS